MKSIKTNVAKKKTLLIGVLILLTSLKALCQLSLVGDKDKPVFQRYDLGKMTPVTVLFADGTTENANIKREPPEEFGKPDALFEFEIGESNPKLKSLGAAPANAIKVKILAKTFDAFQVDGNIWAKRPVPILRDGLNKQTAYGVTFVVLTRQGAIQQYYGSIYYDNKKNKAEWRDYKVTYKIDGKSPDVNYTEMIADCEALNGALHKDKSNLDSVLTAYNLWYEKQYPRKVKYIFSNGPAPFPAKPMTLGDMKQRNKERKDSINSAIKERVAARPATPDPSIASKKENLPPKKETFSAKVKRLESEGNKIGVRIESQKITLRNTGGGCVEGTKEKDFENPAYAQMVADKLNELYQTKTFEVVSLSQVPMKMIKTFTVDDWWATCYKVVVSLSQSRAYSASVNLNAEYEVQYFIDNKAAVIEYIDDGKNTSNYLKRQYNMGDGYSNTVKYKECGSIDKFGQLIDTKETLERFEKSQAEKFSKLVDKWD